MKILYLCKRKTKLKKLILSLISHIIKTLKYHRTKTCVNEIYIYSVKFLETDTRHFSRYFCNDVLKSLEFQGLFKKNVRLYYTIRVQGIDVATLKNVLFITCTRITPEHRNFFPARSASHRTLRTTKRKRK